MLKQKKGMFTFLEIDAQKQLNTETVCTRDTEQSAKHTKHFSLGERETQRGRIQQNSSCVIYCISRSHHLQLVVSFPLTENKHVFISNTSLSV